MIKQNYLISFILLLFCISYSYGQLYRFQNPEHAAISVNPANTGNFDGVWRGQILLREQSFGFEKPYFTYVIQFDTKLYYYSKKIHVGFLYINDNSFSHTLSSNEFLVSAAYKLQVGPRSYLLPGVQIGIGSISNAVSGISFPDQYSRNTGDFEPDAETEEVFDVENNVYMTINAGLIYKYVGSMHSFDAGFSLNRLNKPDYGQYDIKVSMPLVTSLHLTDEIRLKEGVSVNPHVRYILVGTSSEWNLGISSEMSRSFNDIENSISAGFYLTLGPEKDINGCAILLGCEYKNVKLHLLYEIGVGSVDLYSSSNDGFEVSVTFRRPERVIKKNLPNNYYY